MTFFVIIMTNVAIERRLKMELMVIEKILGGRRILHRHIKNKMDLIELSRIGVSKNALLHLAKYLNITMHQIADFLPVTERTVQRYSPDTRFKRVVSEQILHIAKVAAKGSEVFQDRDKFLKWLNFPNKALANQTPISLLNSTFGADMVLEELGRIEHGLFA